jgi:uncharacterized membrane protein YczE
LVVGWALGGTVGIGTGVFVLLIGPAVGTGVMLLRRRAVPVAADRPL